MYNKAVYKERKSSFRKNLSLHCKVFPNLSLQLFYEMRSVDIYCLKVQFLKLSPINFIIAHSNIG